ncbi:hypothetical protein ACFX13_025821 [Malus domestica]
MENIEHKHVEARKTLTQVSPGGRKEVVGQRKYLSSRAGKLDLTQAFVKPISTAPILPNSCIQIGRNVSSSQTALVPPVSPVSPSSAGFCSSELFHCAIRRSPSNYRQDSCQIPSGFSYGWDVFAL